MCFNYFKEDTFSLQKAIFSSITTLLCAWITVATKELQQHSCPLNGRKRLTTLVKPLATTQVEW